LVLGLVLLAPRGPTWDVSIWDTGLGKASMVDVGRLASGGGLPFRSSVLHLIHNRYQFALTAVPDAVTISIAPLALGIVS